MDQHSYNFFGQKTALFFNSPSKFDSHVFFRVIKKKNNETWEKPSQGEGVIIRLSLEEQVQVLDVLEQKADSWSGYHKYKGNGTPIKVAWKKDKEPEKNTIWINIGNYSKMLSAPEIQILKMLMSHILEEKIAFATFSKKNPQQSKRSNNKELSSLKEAPSEHQDASSSSTITSKKRPPSYNEFTCLTEKGRILREYDDCVEIQFITGEIKKIPLEAIKSPFNRNMNVQEFSYDSSII